MNDGARVWLRKCKDNLESADFLRKNGTPDGTVDRAYFAMFDAAKAMGTGEAVVDRGGKAEPSHCCEVFTGLAGHNRDRRSGVDGGLFTGMHLGFWINGEVRGFSSHPKAQITNRKRRASEVSLSAVKTRGRIVLDVHDALHAICSTGKGRCWFCDRRLPRVEQAVRTGWDVQRVEGERVASIILVCPRCQPKPEDLEAPESSLAARF